MQGGKSENQDIIIEYKQAEYEQEHSNPEDGFSIIELKDEIIPYIDDNVSDFSLEDVETEGKHESPETKEKVIHTCHCVSVNYTNYIQSRDKDDRLASDQFLQLSVKGLRKIVSANKKVDNRKEGGQDLRKMHQILVKS